MAHARTQIRQAIAAAVTGLASTGNRVYINRQRPRSQAQLPCLMISPNNESSETLSLGNAGAVARAVVIEIKSLASGTDTAAVDDTLDQITAEVETVLQNNTLGGLVQITELTETNFSFDDSGETKVGAVVMSWQCQYQTQLTQPETAL